MSWRARWACRIPSISITLWMALWAGQVWSSDFYQWTDEAGETHFATSLEQVPEKYREQVKHPEPAQGAWATEGRQAATAPDRAANPAAAAAIDEGALLRFEVPYKASEGSARRVIIPVTFNDQLTAPMALDTGSPGLIVSIDLAVRLGVFSRDNGTLFVATAGIGGVAPAVLTVIESVSVEGARDVFIPTTVTESLSDEFDGLIGMDFLSNYTVSIDSRKRVVVFQQTPPDPQARGGHDEDWWRRNFEQFHTAYDHWRAYAASVEDRPGRKIKAFAEFQLRESERLFRRLDVFASDNAVPRHWR